jgi:hypothetical protein
VTDVPIEVLRAAREWATRHRHAVPDDRLIELAFAAGLSAGQAAELDLSHRDERERAAERNRIKKLLTIPALAALRCVPDGRIQNGCVIHDGATVRERLRQAWLSAFRDVAEGGEPNAG